MKSFKSRVKIKAARHGFVDIYNYVGIHLWVCYQFFLFLNQVETPVVDQKWCGTLRVS